MIKNDYVVQIVEANSADDLGDIRSYQACIDLSELNPVPEVGWKLEGSILIDPSGLAIPVKHISKEKFLSRFTDDEICNIEDFAKGTSPYAKAVRASLKRQEQAMFIDLNYQKTKDGINNLVALHLLTAERADAILNTPLSDEEKYKG